MEPVIVYSKDNCPQCTSLKKALELKQIEYQEINISAQPEARDVVIEKGFRQMPVINDNGDWTSGFTPSNFMKILQAHAPKPADVRPMA